MVELIATIALFIGLIGMGVILFRKIPVLSELPPQAIKGPGVFRRVRDKVKSNGTLKTFSSGELLLQRILSKFRILSLRTENKTSTWLGKLRQRSLNKKKTFPDDYWKKLKKRR
jgi:hypothetical protein